VCPALSAVFYVLSLGSEKQRKNVQFGSGTLPVAVPGPITSKRGHHSDAVLEECTAFLQRPIAALSWLAVCSTQ
jgi:hypothetical protein